MNTTNEAPETSPSVGEVASTPLPITMDPKTGLPVFACGSNAPASRWPIEGILALERAILNEDLLGKYFPAPPGMDDTENNEPPRITVDPKTGWPMFVCDPDPPASRMSLEELLELERVALYGEELEPLGQSR